MRFTLPDKIEWVLSTLNAAGYEAYIVGGCVRDLLMGKTPNDYDITTSALPLQVKECFKNEKIIETGLQHGTITLVIDGENIEITTYRIDGEYNDNRRPESVEFSNSIEDDLKRRDFTVNAIAYNLDKGFVDLFSGRNDIEKGVINCVGDADKRFGEDALRILRALRFSSVLGFDISKATSDSIHRNKNLILNVSVERIWIEFKKLICGKNAYNVLLEYYDVVGVLIPEMLKSVNFEQNTPYHCFDVYKHTITAVNNAPYDEIIRLSLFFHDIGKPYVYSEHESGTGHFYGHAKRSEEIVNTVLTRLKSDNFTKEKVCMFVKYHDRLIDESEKAVKRLLTKLSFDDLRTLLIIKRCDNLAQAPHVHAERCAHIDRLNAIIDKIERDGACLSLRTLNINGNDLKALGFKEGKIIGKILNLALQSVINEEVANERERLLKFAEKFTKE
ncbi:MAG: HD domain-containing protein [Clostridia bacterium]|nr:HD domain-containing protein [Clostridia bacterium]